MHLPSRSLGSLGAGSDYAPFIHFLGISSMDIAYTYDRVSGTSSPASLAPSEPAPSLSSCAPSASFPLRTAHAPLTYQT